VKRVMLAGVVLAIVLSFAQSPAKAEWLCGVNKCVWVTYDVDEPDFTLQWGPPIRPSCYWKRGLFGRWKFVC